MLGCVYVLYLFVVVLVESLCLNMPSWWMLLTLMGAVNTLKSDRKSSFSLSGVRLLPVITRLVGVFMDLLAIGAEIKDSFVYYV